MRLKQKVALLLAGVVTIGSVGFMNPVEVRAEAADSFTITVPANVNITNNGWNSIGTVKVAGIIDTGKKITVSIATTNEFKLKNGTNEVAYTIKKSADDESSTTSFDFAAETVNARGGASQSIGADVDSFTGKPAGNYTDTITFTAALGDNVTGLTMKNASGNTLAAADLGEPSEFTVNGKTYYAYNDFIKNTSGSNWYDAMNFVKMLNDNVYDGHNDWILINDVVADVSSYKSAIGKAWNDNYCYSSTNRGGVNYFWSSVEYNADGAFLSFTYMDACNWDFKSCSLFCYGFLVLRGSSNAAATEVTYDRTDGSGTLSSANLGEPTSWTYDDVTYDVYNAFIPSSSGSSWNDAMGFVNALKAANYDGHGDWTLLSEEMAKDWYNQYGSSVNRGGVRYLWLSYEDESICAWSLNCGNGKSAWSYKLSADPKYGFVVLRGSSNASAPAPVTYNKKDSTGTLSSEYLGTATTWTYNGMTYDVYNGFIPHSLGSSWNDAMGFINALNTANYDGHNNWTLLSSQEMATAYAQNGTGVMPSDCGGVIFLWSSVPCNDLAYCLRCDDYVHWQYGDKSSSSGNGFVVLRGSSNASAATEVTYARTGKDALSSANLGTPTSWTYDNTTYQVYNDFIPSSSGSSWNDAVGFINDLNTANYDGHSDWTLLSSEAMATAYAQNGTGVMPSDRGGVYVLWSSVEYENNENDAYYLGCNYTYWETAPKSSAESVYGFVILRRSSN